jgi:phospholipase/lecithinase/hemolysin
MQFPSRPNRRAWTRTALAVLASTALVAGCGGGSDSIPLPTITSVKVMGDSLADVGTFGVKFTVQGTATSAQSIFPELVAASYGISQHCNYFAFTGTNFTLNTAQTGCTNYAIGGGRINGATANNGAGLEGGAADPRNVGVQLQAAAAAGNHTANDLLLIDGGGNDAADVVKLYLAIGAAAAVSPTAQLAAVNAYGNALKTILPATTVDPLLASAQGLADAGGIYMKALATSFAGQIRTLALDKGAQHVVLINMPAITNTPLFQGVLDQIATANGGGAAGTQARTLAAALFDNWVKAFNNELAAQVAGESRILLVDMYTLFNNWVAFPSSFGLTNVTLPACAATGVSEDNAAFWPSCNSTALSQATPLAGTGSEWWRTFLFSDSFHPTPYGHQMAATYIRAALFNKSWQ